MRNRVSELYEPAAPTAGERSDDVQRIGDILDQLLAQYQQRFPELNISVVETPASVF